MKKCNDKIKNDMDKFLQDSGLDEIFLMGGAVLDPLIKEDMPINDYDVCTPSEDKFYKAIGTLQGKGYQMSEVVRTHNIYIVLKNKQGVQFDFSCMNPEDNGIFSIEKMYARFPGNEIVDKYDSLGSFRRKELRLAASPKKEGVYNIFRRFIAVAGKYNLPIGVNGPNQETINTMKEEFKEQCNIAVPQDKVRCLDRLIKVIAKNGHRKEFIKDFANQELLKEAFPVIHDIFSDPSFQNNAALDKIEKPSDLLKNIMEYAGSEEEKRDNTLDLLATLRNREASRASQDVLIFTRDILDEKTSKSRLSKNVLSPVFSAILQKGRKE